MLTAGALRTWWAFTVSGMSFTWNTYGWLNLGIDALSVLMSLCVTAYYLHRWDPSPRVTTKTVHLSVRAFALAFLGWLPAAAFIGGIVGFCLVARLGWTAVTVALPLLFLYLALARRAPWLAVAAVALIGAKYYGEVWEPANLEVQRVSILVPGLAKRVKLVHLSDLQTDVIGTLHERVRREANAFEPDLVVFTGDAINHPSLTEVAGDWLAGFTPTGRKYFVTGDVDPNVEGLLRRGGFENLYGRRMVIRPAGARLTLLGVDLWKFRKTGF